MSGDAVSRRDAGACDNSEASGVSEASGAQAAGGYSPARRTPRKHRRVVRQGTELFDADGVKLEPSDMMTERQRAADDDKRILTELPPHWAQFSERGR